MRAIRSSLIEWSTCTVLSHYQRQGTDPGRKNCSNTTVKPAIRQPSASPPTPP